jgi:hypothetical protein
MINSFVPVDHVVVLTKGPSDSTNILLNYIFQVAHKKQDIGRSAAATVVGTLVVLSIGRRGRLSAAPLSRRPHDSPISVPYDRNEAQCHHRAIAGCAAVVDAALVDTCRRAHAISDPASSRMPHCSPVRRPLRTSATPGARRFFSLVSEFQDCCCGHSRRSTDHDHPGGLRIRTIELSRLGFGVLPVLGADRAGGTDRDRSEHSDDRPDGSC